MAGARQQDVSGAMISILKKMDSMLSSTNEIYEQQLSLLNSIDTIQKTTVVSELKTQTKILQSIEAKLKSTSEGSSGKGNTKAFKEAFGDVGNVIEKILKSASGLDDKKSDQIAGFFNKLADSINTFLKKVNPNDVKEIANAISVITKGVLLYALVMVAATPLLVLAIPGVILFGLSIRLLLLAAGTAKKDGVQAIEAILTLSKGVLVYVLAMLAVTIAMPFVLIGTLILVGTLFLLSLGLKAIGSKDSKEGIWSLVGISLSIVLFGLAILAFSKLVSVESAILVGLAVAGISLVFYLVGKFASDIIVGALTIVGVAIGVIALSLGMMIWTKSKVTSDDILTLGGTLTMLGVGMALFGAASELIIPGALALAAVGGALILLSGAFAIFKASGFKQEDGDNLQYALTSMVNGFLGGSFPGGLVESLKFAGQAAARAALLAITAGPMLLAGAALIPITYSLQNFKKIGFTQTDGDNLEFAIGSIVRAFGIVTDYDRQKALGFNVDPVKLMIGIESLSGAGRVLGGLADGVKSWANLEVTDWEVINGGTKDAKLVIKNRRKLTESDFDNAAYGMSKVISAIAKPFADVGKLEKEGQSGNPLIDAIFGNGYVAAGIASLKHSGDTLVNLAKGVKSFANLEITDYEVINGGTDKAKIVPKAIVKLTDKDLDSAGVNISKVLGVVAKAFAEVGKAEKESSGWFSGGFVSKGVSVLAGIGDNLSKIGESLILFANGSIPQFQLINGGTKDAKLVPAAPLRITDSMLNKAAMSIGNILGVLGGELSKFGQWTDSNEDSIKSATRVAKSMSEVVGDAAKGLSEWSKIDDSAKAVNGMSSYFDTLRVAFDPNKTKDLALSSIYFGQYAHNADMIGKQADNISKVADSYDSIQKSMKLMQSHINGMDLKKLTLTDSMMKSLAALAKNPEAMAKLIAESVDKSFDELIKAIKDMVKTTNEESATSAKVEPVLPINFNPIAQQKQQEPTPPPAPPVPPPPIIQNVRIINLDELKTMLTVGPSDRRLKTNIKQIGKSKSGIKIYTFSYIGDIPTQYQGVMAQDLIGTRWENALISGSDGYYAVDYSKIDVEFKKIK